jgi:TorA maturation chaperone TorD
MAVSRTDADSRAAALPFIAWSRVWSPVAPEPLRREAWEALELPGCFDGLSAEFWSAFHVGSPVPRVPLLLHAALHLDGGHVREDWMRVMSHLQLRFDEFHLPPDQLGAACEVYACAIDSQEPVLIEELRRRYLLPWCRFAVERLARDDSPLGFLPEQFEVDLLGVETGRGEDTNAVG